jgi:hypothetical protein
MHAFDGWKRILLHGSTLPSFTATQRKRFLSSTSPTVYCPIFKDTTYAYDPLPFFDSYISRPKC